MQKNIKKPSPLFEIQNWFGKTISQPLQPDHHLPKSDADRYLKPSYTLTAHQRIEIYHQQYWWRLLKCLQNNFPTLTRLFGYHDFNQQIGIPYLSAHPPTHWALCRLGDTLPKWIESNYTSEEDQEIALFISQIDWATQEAFWIEALTPIDFAHRTSVDTLSKKLTLQPHVHLFELNGDLFSFRETFLEKEVDYWSFHPFPKMDYRKCYFALFRNLKNAVVWKELSQCEHDLLSDFKKKSTISEACANIEKKGYKEEAEELLPLWFREWTYLKWFVEA